MTIRSAPRSTASRRSPAGTDATTGPASSRATASARSANTGGTSRRGALSFTTRRRSSRGTSDSTPPQRSVAHAPRSARQVAARAPAVHRSVASGDGRFSSRVQNRPELSCDHAIARSRQWSSLAVEPDRGLERGGELRAPRVARVLEHGRYGTSGRHAVGGEQARGGPRLRRGKGRWRAGRRTAGGDDAADEQQRTPGHPSAQGPETTNGLPPSRPLRLVAAVWAASRVRYSPTLTL